MAYGAALFDPWGRRILDTNDGVFSIIGWYSVNVNPGFYSGSFSHGDLARGNPFYFLVDIPSDAWFNTSLKTDIEFSGTTCNWYVHPSIYGGGSPDQSGTLSFYYGYF